MDKSSIEVIKGDITKWTGDAIVNAAKTTLMGGAGVDGAIHSEGGPSILEECKDIIADIGKLDPGKAVITGAGNLPSKYVIHTVGPLWRGGRDNEEETLRECYMNCLKLAVEQNISSIAFPNISTGIYHFPKDKAAKISIQAIKEFMENNATKIKVTLVCLDEENENLCRGILENK